MTAIVGCAGLVFQLPSSADFSARPLPSNVASHVLFHSTPLSSLSSLRLSALGKSGRRSRRRVVEAREGSSFAYSVSDELAFGHEEFSACQSAVGRNARVTRASVQGEKCVSRWRIFLADEGKHPWALHRQQARSVKASAMHHSRSSKFSESAHMSESYDTDDFIDQNQKQAFHNKSRSSPDVQHANNSFGAKKHPRAPLPTENQQYRLHNEVTIFKGITEPQTSWLPCDNDAHKFSLPEDATNAFAKVKEKSPKSNMERLERKKKPQKGTLFMSKLEEELSNLKKKVDVHKQGSTFIEEARRVPNASFVCAAEASQGLTKEGQGVQVSGTKLGLKAKETQMARPFDSDNSVEDATAERVEDSNQGLRGKGMYNSVLATEHLQGQEKSLLSKTARGDEVGFTSFNLFASSPSVPSEVDRSYPSTFVPVSRNRRPFSRQLQTSVGSRSSPSRRSVTNNNKGHLKFGPQMTTGIDNTFKGSRGETQRNLRSDEKFPNKMDNDKDKTQIDSSKGTWGCIEHEGNFAKLESQVARRISDAVESGKKEEQMEPWSGGKEDIMTWGATNVEHINRANLNATRVMPLKSSLFATPYHGDSESDDKLIDGFELSSDGQGNVATFANSDLTFFSDCEDAVLNQSDIREFDDEVSLVFSDTEDDVPTTSSSGEVDGRNAHDTIQLNASEKPSNDKEHNSLDSANWHKHNFPDLPFEFQFSYSETPQKPVLRYREPPVSPFGPSTMKRPWIGDRPHNKSKKKPRVLDSFHPPPANLKGVKHVQDPGPYPEGQGPKTAKSREEIMGEPLTKEEIIYLVEKCRREPRQLNLGRDGLTHNMLDLIHSHWKRRRVCRIKCKGVPTVDMDNVTFHIEDKTGGKVIYQTGGVLYLFRGRNYNYKDRPHIPLMLWKPATPVYPKLIQPAPDGLTEEEAERLRKLGRKVEPMCKLWKNGVYSTLVDEVRAAFKVDELVRIDCRGLNPSDYKKIGAKLRDLVPCVLLSFDKEHILMWKGKLETIAEGTGMSQASDSKATADNAGNGAEHSDPTIDEVNKKAFKPPPMVQEHCKEVEASDLLAGSSFLFLQRKDKSREEFDNAGNGAEHSDSSIDDAGRTMATADDTCNGAEHSDPSIPFMVQDPCEEGEASGEEVDLQFVSSEALRSSASMHEAGNHQDTSAGVGTKEGQVYEEIKPSNYAVDIDALWEHASQSGMAIKLVEEDMDIDLIVRKADELAKFAPLAPEYTSKLIHRLQLKREPDSKPKDEVRMHLGRDLTPRPKKDMKRKFQLPTVGVAGMGGLPVDDLAKLLVKK